MAQAIGDYEAAREFFQNALQWGQDNQSKGITAVSRQNLGNLLSLIELPEAGLVYLREALAIAAEENAIPLMLDIMVDIVLQTPKPQPDDIILKILSLVQQHPASKWETRKKSETVLAQLPTATHGELLPAHAGKTALQELLSEMLAH